MRFFMATILVIVVTLLFYTSHKRHSAPQDVQSPNSFFGKTMNGLGQRHNPDAGVVVSRKGSSSSNAKGNANLKDHDGDGSVDEDDEVLAQEMADRLRAAEQQAKDQANKKAPLRPDSPSDVVGIGSAAGGQKKGKSRISKQDTDDDDDEDEKDDEDSEVEVALHQILKKAPGMYSAPANLVPILLFLLLFLS